MTEEQDDGTEPIIRACDKCAHFPVCHFYPAVLMIVAPSPEKNMPEKKSTMPPFKPEDLAHICNYWTDSLEARTIVLEVDDPKQVRKLPGVDL